ncbi:MAG: hypothetical protein IPK01_16170 [Acidobacteria bacterium]|nr:hypothetical protein [Acidobacteriota bacterium]
MEYLIGAAVGLGVCIFTSLVGMDRDRALYPAMLIVIALLYDLFAAMGGSNQALIMEFAAGVVFIGLAVAGFRSTLWFTVIGLIGHGIFDLFHGQFIQNPGVPAWWPAFCLSADVAIGAYLAVLISSNRIRPVT